MFDWFFWLILPHQTKSWIRSKLTGSLWPIYQPQSEGTWFFVLTGCWLEAGVNWIHRKAHQIREDELLQPGWFIIVNHNHDLLCFLLFFLFLFFFFFCESENRDYFYTVQIQNKKGNCLWGTWVYVFIALLA